MSWDLLEVAKRLIATPSISTEGNRAVVEELIPLCREGGFELQFQAPSNGEGIADLNLIAYTPKEGSPSLCAGGLLWVTHLDTVPPGDTTLWTETAGDPFHPTLKGDRIYGLGSADTKLDFLCKLKAVEEVGVKNLKVPFCLVGTYGEERALAGIRRLRDSNLVHPRWALVGEPSELKPVNAHKGILYMRVILNVAAQFIAPLQPKTFLGRAAHGSTPHLGENAIEKGCRWLLSEQERKPHLDLLEIVGGTVHNIVPESCAIKVGEGGGSSRRIEFLRMFWRLMDEVARQNSESQDLSFDPPITTANVGVIRGDREKIEIEFDFRLIPTTDGNDLFEVFCGLERLPGTRVEVLSSNPPMATPPGSEVARRVTDSLRAMGLPTGFESKAGNTEGAIVNQMGAETIVIGPGRSTGNIHRPNEFNEIGQLKRAVEFYTAFLRGFC